MDQKYSGASVERAAFLRQLLQLLQPKMTEALSFVGLIMKVRMVSHCWKGGRWMGGDAPFLLAWEVVEEEEEERGRRRRSVI